MASPLSLVEEAVEGFGTEGNDSKIEAACHWAAQLGKEGEELVKQCIADALASGADQAARLKALACVRALQGALEVNDWEEPGAGGVAGANLRLAPLVARLGVSRGESLLGAACASQLLALPLIVQHARAHTRWVCSRGVVQDWVRAFAGVNEVLSGAIDGVSWARIVKESWEHLREALLNSILGSLAAGLSDRRPMSPSTETTDPLWCALVAGDVSIDIGAFARVFQALLERDDDSPIGHRFVAGCRTVLQHGSTERGLELLRALIDGAMCVSSLPLARFSATLSSLLEAVTDPALLERAIQLTMESVLSSPESELRVAALRFVMARAGTVLPAEAPVFRECVLRSAQMLSEQHECRGEPSEVLDRLRPWLVLRTIPTGPGRLVWADLESECFLRILSAGEPMSVRRLCVEESARFASMERAVGFLSSCLGSTVERLVPSRGWELLPPIVATRAASMLLTGACHHSQATGSSVDPSLLWDAASLCLEHLSPLHLLEDSDLAKAVPPLVDAAAAAVSLAEQRGPMTVVSWVRTSPCSQLSLSALLVRYSLGLARRPPSEGSSKEDVALVVTELLRAIHAPKDSPELALLATALSIVSPPPFAALEWAKQWKEAVHDKTEWKRLADTTRDCILGCPGLHPAALWGPGVAAWVDELCRSS
jgi:hypothetical protein